MRSPERSIHVEMRRQSRRSLIVTAIVLGLLVPILIVAGLSVRRLVTASFQSAEHMRSTRALALETLKLQLDEETGVRGYAVTRDRSFLEPYRLARPQMITAIAGLRSAVDTLAVPSARSSVDEAAALNDVWLRSVAEPLAKGSGSDVRFVQHRGKALVDRFRSSVTATDGALRRREAAIDAAAQSAIDRIVLLVGASAASVLVLAFVFAALQLRTARRLEEERERAEEERRVTAGLRAAYQAEKQIADTLQEAFSQRPLPTLPTLRFSAMYVPATEEARVGGDWYDALELAKNRVLFAIGDVTGHGLAAAVGMSRARQALIAAALADADPASVLRRVNADLLRQDSPLVTAVVGYADADNNEFVYSIAGHPPPLLVAPGQAPKLLDCGALPLGAIVDAEYRTYRVQTVPGASLVLYTDGAVEHSRNVLDGETLLLHAGARALESGADDPARMIHDTIFEKSGAGDDVAILTVGFADEGAAAVTLSGSQANADFRSRIGTSVEPTTIVDAVAERRLQAGRKRPFPDRLVS